MFFSMQNVLESQCLVDNLVDFLEWSVLVNASFFTLNIIFDEVDRGCGHEKSILLDTVYRFFLKKKTLTNDLK